MEKTLMLRKTEGRRRGWQRTDEMVGWPHRLNGHEFEQALEVSDGQGSLACCSPWGHKSKWTELTYLRDNNSTLNLMLGDTFHFFWNTFKYLILLITSWVISCTILYIFIKTIMIFSISFSVVLLVTSYFIFLIYGKYFYSTLIAGEYFC